MNKVLEGGSEYIHVLGRQLCKKKEMTTNCGAARRRLGARPSACGDRLLADIGLVHQRKNCSVRGQCRKEKTRGRGGKKGIDQGVLH